jgi:hypothetical protein
MEGERDPVRLHDQALPNWPESYCTENNAQIVIGKENYFLSAEGFLMPAKKDQPPPDLRYFKQTQR